MARRAMYRPVNRSNPALIRIFDMFALYAVGAVVVLFAILNLIDFKRLD
jgi:hypothetical protein